MEAAGIEWRLLRVTTMPAKNLRSWFRNCQGIVRIQAALHGSKWQPMTRFSDT
jgi:hypothetical protein